jgi:hypothetical protein
MERCFFRARRNLSDPAPVLPSNRDNRAGAFGRGDVLGLGGGGLEGDS